MATDLFTERLDEWLEKMRGHAMRHPARQIVPPGTIDLEGVKSQRKESHQRGGRGGILRKSSHSWVCRWRSRSACPQCRPPCLQALLDVLEANGIDGLDAMMDIIKTIEFLRKVASHADQTSAQRG